MCFLLLMFFYKYLNQYDRFRDNKQTDVVLLPFR